MKKPTSRIQALAVSSVLVLGSLSAAVNDVFDVYTAVELTNACAQATFNFNTIRVHPGVYDLTGMAMKPTTVGTDNKVSTGVTLILSTYGGRLVGTGERPDDTIIKGGGETDRCQVLSFSKVCTVSNLTFTGGWNANGSGGVASWPNATFTDCVFSNNYASGFGGVFDQITALTRCRFINNKANCGGVLRPITDGKKSPTLVRDCYFEGNTATESGGICYYGCTWSNCVFVGNSSALGGVFGKSFSFPNVATDCRFEGNFATGSEGGSVAVNNSQVLAAATNCTFVGNYTPAGSVMVGTGAELVNCTLVANTSMPLVVGATLKRCTVRGNFGNKGNSNPLLQKCAIYNSLLAENRAGNHNMSRICSGEGTALYNCTVVSNVTQASIWSVITDGAVVNTIFDANKVVNSDNTFVKLMDLNASQLPTAMTNCLWTAQTGTVSGDAVVGGGLVTASDLRFSDATAGDWTLQRKSAARNAGWSDAAYLELVGETDLAGNPRVFSKDGAKIDVGCYECCQSTPGLCVIIR